MTLTSVLEDLRLRTLDPMPSEFSRLAYLASLKTAEAYEHWGLAQRYGPQAAARAIARAHSEVVMRVLEMTVAQAAVDLHQAAVAEHTSDAEYFRRLGAGSALMPHKPGGASLKQLEWMLFVLSRLVTLASPQTDQAA